MSRKPKKPGIAGNSWKNPEDPGTGAAIPLVVEVIPARRGRPTKRTPELEGQIAECLRLGMSYPQTCDACGISQTQFRNWRKHFRDFQDLIRRAEAEAVKLNLAVIQAAAASGKSWQAAAWFLERKHPEQWGKTETLSIEARKDAITEAIKINAARTPEHLRELRMALQLPRDSKPELVDAAIDHAKAEMIRRGQSEIFGVPYEPKPFEGIQKGTRQETADKIAAIARNFGIDSDEGKRADKIAALIELQAAARKVAGKPALTKADAFEAAARELDHEGDGKKPA